MRPAWIDQLPSFFHQSFAGVEAWQWVGLAVLLLLALLGNFFGRFAARYILRLRDRALGRDFGTQTHKGLQTATGLLCAANAPLLILAILDLPEAFEEVIRKGLYTVSLVGIILLTFALWDAVSDQISERSSDRRTSRILVPIARKFVRAFTFITGVLIALGFIFSVNVTTVLASLGIGGLVIALAAKDSVENIFGSLTILFDMPFGIGDWVKVGDVDGIVEEINLRSTRIRTFEDSVITLPNSNLIKASVENLGRRRYRRLKTNIPLDFGNSPDKIDAYCQALRDLFEHHPKIRSDVNRVGFVEYSEKALLIQIYVYIEAGEYNEELVVRHEIMLQIMLIAEQMEVKFAFPAKTVYVIAHPPTPEQEAAAPVP